MLWIVAPSSSLVRELFNVIPLEPLYFVGLCFFVILFIAVVNYIFAHTVAILEAEGGEYTTLTMVAGRLIKNTTIIGKSKINYTLQKQNILQRYLMTANLHVFTAGVSSAGFIIQDINVNDIHKLNLSNQKADANA